MPSTLSKVATLAIGAGLSGSMAVAEGVYHGYETPIYTIEQSVDGAELRAYEPHMLAVVTVSGNRDSALNRGFQVLANYIFGGNSSASKVAMTAPVSQSQSETIAMTAPATQTGEGGLWTVTFMMPAQYTEDTLPVPNSEAIRFVRTETERKLVLMFSGRATDSLLAQKTEELRAIAARAGIAISGPPVFAFYDDPFTLPWNRRNEVAFLVDGS